MTRDCYRGSVAVGSWLAATKAEQLSLFQVGEKARGLELVGEVSLAAEMFVLDVSKPRKNGGTSKRRIDSVDISFPLP
jgi:hypothetical protein